MSLGEQDRNTIVSLEINKARSTYDDAEVLVNLNRLSSAASRLYYAVFHAVSALLIHDGHAVKSHKGAFVAFCQHYIYTGSLPQEMGRLLSQLETMRENSDYNCVYEVTRAEITDRLIPAKIMIDSIADYIRDHPLSAVPA